MTAEVTERKPDEMPAAAANRCRLVLVLWCDRCANALADIESALDGGDVASVILAPGNLDESRFQKLCETLVPAIQQRGAAVMIAGETRVAGRTGADGIHVEGGGVEAVAEAVGKFGGKMMVGAGAVKNRHAALMTGEAQPDYVMFGKLDGDIRAEPHPKNIALGEWWSQLVEIPCIVSGGSAIESVAEVARTGAEFVALSSAIFAGEKQGEGAVREAVRLANSILDEQAPRFDHET